MCRDFEAETPYKEDKPQKIKILAYVLTETIRKQQDWLAKDDLHELYKEVRAQLMARESVHP